MEKNEFIRGNKKFCAGAAGGTGKISGPGVRQEMELRCFVGILERRKQVFIHEVQMFEPAPPAKASETGGLDYVSQWPERIGEKSRSKIDTTQMSLQSRRRQNPERRAPEEIGGYLVKFVHKNIFSAAELPTFFKGAHFAAAPPFAVLVKNGEDIDARQELGQPLFEKALGFGPKVHGQGDIKTDIMKIFCDILQPCQTMPDTSRLKNQDMWLG